ncbi:MAG: hypothetical protein L6V93_15490 [Clostridiales bacterium]|nr:MAG: hypothetical protein L6V93_15490 [Clostridiales bacterium]
MKKIYFFIIIIAIAVFLRFIRMRRNFSARRTKKRRGRCFFTVVSGEKRKGYCKKS